MEEEKKSGNRGLGALSGKAMFTFDPTLFVDDDAACDEYERDEEE